MKVWQLSVFCVAFWEDDRKDGILRGRQSIKSVLRFYGPGFKVKYAVVKNTETRKNASTTAAGLRGGPRRVPAVKFTLFPGRNLKLRMDPTECADGAHAWKETPHAQMERVSSLKLQETLPGSNKHFGHKLV